MALANDSGQQAIGLMNGVARWLLPFAVFAILWGGATEYRTQANSAKVDRHEREINEATAAYARVDERLKGIKEALDKIERTIANRP
jgi:hypothetical protein